MKKVSALKRKCQYFLMGIIGLNLLMLISCSAPMNLNFDSARMMDKGTIEVQGSYSRYHFRGEYTNENVGLKLSYAPSDRYNLKLRGELMMDNKTGSNTILDTYVIELDNKFSSVNPRLKDHLAFSMPLSLYVSWWGPSFVFDPRMYVTLSKSDKFEFTMIPKCHISFGSGLRALPGISLGMGFSKDLNRWAIRPEVGYDSYLSFGIGYSHFINVNKSKEKKMTQ